MPKKVGALSPQRAPEADEPAGGTALVRVTVNLTRKSIQALEQLADSTGQSKTDTINRALQVYALVNEIMERDGGSLYVRHLDGENERIRLV